MFALLFYNGSLDLKWFLVGNVVLDVFFILSFVSVAGFKPRSLRSMLTFGNKAVQTPFHKIGFVLHSVFALFIFLALCFVPNIALKSLFSGIVLHLIIDFATHKNEPNPIFYPFSTRKVKTGFMTWNLSNWNVVRPTLQVLSILFLVKYLVFGFIF